MDKTIIKFKNHTEYESFVNSREYIEPHTSMCADNGEVHYNVPPMPLMALRFSTPSTGILEMYNADIRDIQYSTDARTWNEWDGSSITFGNGTDVYVRGNNPDGLSTSSNTSTHVYFQTTGSDITVEGNVMHLLSYTQEITEIPCDYCFYHLFGECEGLVSASGLILPSNTTNSCYRAMFVSCEDLVDVPELPATVLSSHCYSEMFSGCSSLVDAPELPSINLAENCYWNMFADCSSLVDAPELPATILTDSCYTAMFYNCSSLVNAPALSAITLAEKCYSSMFRGCTSLVNAPELPATTLLSSCYNQMFYGCTSLMEAPVLPAGRLTTNCYNQMFYGCSKLNHIKIMATNIASGTTPLTNWVRNVSSTGTFECAVGMSSKFASGVSGIPSGWTVVEVAA